MQAEEYIVQLLSLAYMALGRVEHMREYSDSLIHLFLEN